MESKMKGEDALSSKVMKLVAQRFPSELALMGEAVVHARVRAGVAKARSVPIHDDRRVALFVLGWALTGLEGPRNPGSWAERCRRVKLRDPVSAHSPLVVRDAQLEAMEALAQERLRLRVEAHLERVFPDRPIGRPFVERAEAKAAGYGIEDERSLCMLADLMLILGEDFEAHPPYRWCAALLGAALPSRAKLALIFKRMLAEEDDEQR